MQSAYVQDFDGSRRDPAKEALAFQPRERALGGFGHGSKIIREIKTVYRQFQERPLLIEEFRNAPEIENEGGKTLTRVLLAEDHDPMLGLAKIIHDLDEQMELDLRFGQHRQLHPMPWDAVYFGGTDGFRGVDVLPVLRKTEKIARHPECENLPAAIFGVPVYPNDSLIDDEKKIGRLPFGEKGVPASPIGEQRRIVEKAVLFLTRKQVLRARGFDIYPEQWSCTNFQTRFASAVATVCPNVDVRTAFGRD
ncbi:MAG TPA: hypothetical protein VNH44_13915 [Micropepsaceae bacterium]|nr:hypothetical protein [Micropepsaceae bacterium]